MRMSEFKKHWKTGRHDETDFRVEIWTGGDGRAFAKSVQIEEQPPLLFNEGELEGANADEAFALAEAQVKQVIEDRDEQPDAADSKDD
jgi:hypothetical protein